MKDSQNERLAGDDKPFSKGDLVTRTGQDIQLVITLDDDCYFGGFKCLYDVSGTYCVGEVEDNISARYEKITRENHSTLFDIASKLEF